MNQKSLSYNLNTKTKEKGHPYLSISTLKPSMKCIHLVGKKDSRSLSQKKRKKWNWKKSGNWQKNVQQSCEGNPSKRKITLLLEEGSQCQLQQPPQIECSMPVSRNNLQKLLNVEFYNIIVKLIDEEEDESSAQKPSIRNSQSGSMSGFSLQSPQYGRKSSKSPTSMASMSEENLVALYNSLLESCLGQNERLQIPSILCIFFSWIPQTNL